MTIIDEKLKKILAAAYFRKENTIISDQWQTRTMAHIYAVGPLNTSVVNFFIFDSFVWRFATAACVLVLILSIYVFQAGFQPEYELATLFMNDPLGFSLVQSFEMLL